MRLDFSQIKASKKHCNIISWRYAICDRVCDINNCVIRIAVLRSKRYCNCCQRFFASCALAFYEIHS